MNEEISGDIIIYSARTYPVSPWGRVWSLEIKVERNEIDTYYKLIQVKPRMEDQHRLTTPSV